MSEQIIQSGKFTVTGPPDDPTEFKAEIEVGPGGAEITATAKDGLIRAMFESLLESFKAHGGENYVEYCVKSGGEAFRILLQRDKGETPAQQNTRLRAEIASLTQQLADAELANRVLTLAANELDKVRRERDQLREQLAAAQNRVRDWRETAENYMHHCSKACEQLAQTEAKLELAILALSKREPEPMTETRSK